LVRGPMRQLAWDRKKRGRRLKGPPKKGNKRKGDKLPGAGRERWRRVPHHQEGQKKESAPKKSHGRGRPKPLNAPQQLLQKEKTEGTERSEIQSKKFDRSISLSNQKGGECSSNKDISQGGKN